MIYFQIEIRPGSEKISIIHFTISHARQVTVRAVVPVIYGRKEHVIRYHLTMIVLLRPWNMHAWSLGCVRDVSDLMEWSVVLTRGT